jgi:hypothetical protein
LKALLEKFGFTSKVLCCVKDEGTNLGTMTTTLKLVISWEALNLLTPFNGVCFWHAMNKIVQCVTTNDKVFKDLGTINIKYAKTLFHACITWPKKSVDNPDLHIACIHK